MITKEDVGLYSFSKYRKVTLTPLSDQVLPPGTEVQTKEGVYICAESSRLTVDQAGDVYPVAESEFRKTYERAD
jgi:hypothetical protein